MLEDPFADEGQKPEPRPTILPLVLLALLVGVVLAFALYSGRLHAEPALSGPIFRSFGQNGQPAALRIFEAPCSDPKVLQRIRPHHHQEFKAARLTWGGQDWASCWIELDGIVYSIDEEGSEFQPVPRRMFRDDSV